MGCARTSARLRYGARMSPPVLALYPRLLGDAWATLPEAVRRGHEVAPVLRTTGDFTVTHGPSWLVRVAVAVLRLPRAGPHVRTQLDARAYEDHQRWERDFAGRKLYTRQYLLGDGRMSERTGPLELCFRVAVMDGELRYGPNGVRLCLGRWRIPLPSWCAPRITGRAWAVAGERAMHVHIEIAAPWIGTVVTYGGPLDVAGT